jgi:hypothetical protein
MNYPDGRAMRLGDRVDQNGRRGWIVCSIDTDEYGADYPREHWSRLGNGVLILFDDIGLVHYGEPDEDICLVARAATAAAGSR